MSTSALLTKESTQRSITVDGIALNYYEAGTGPVLLCTHGAGPGANAWDNTSHALQQLAQTFHVILLDMPGFGGSEMGVKRGDEHGDVFLANLTRAFLDALDIPRASLYGSSAFSAVALRFALRYPERTDKVVIQAYSPVPHPVQTAGLTSLQTFSKDPSLENMRAMCELFVPNSALLTPEFIESRFDAALVPGHLASRAEFSVKSHSDIAADLPNLTAPVLVTWGAKDNMIPVEGVLDDLALIPDVRAHVWGGTGHFVVFEHPDEFARLVTDFLEE